MVNSTSKSFRCHLGVKGPHYGIVLSALCFEKVGDINKR